ncbi:MAG: hypothetical protein D6687_08295 [Acidobacteria bacterium]|jgi:hypothetical protein|nr:MAG: hypothetical protein D6687_08295 [Acidobacteriota bacterium]GIU82137.1 MAG: hypothetical protein KatS3mg006_1201 [Pyrinomonadaceae bacterium]
MLVFVRLILLALLIVFSLQKVQSQRTVDKIVATVSYGFSETSIITYSDILWQIALSPNSSQINNPEPEELNRALELLIEQRLLLLEAKKIPRDTPTEAEINSEIERIIRQFPSVLEFERRLRSVGFESIKDPNFQKIIEQRIIIEKYLDFRFRSFVIVTPEEEKRYYEEVFLPEFRQRNPNSVLPSFESVRQTINQILVESKVERNIEEFLEEAKSRADIQLFPKP